MFKALLIKLGSCEFFICTPAIARMRNKAPVDNENKIALEIIGSYGIRGS